MNATNAYRLDLTATFERQWHRPESQRQRQQTKGATVAVLDNTVAIPDVPADFHLLEIESIDAVEGTAYNDPDTPETRLKVQLRVCTPGVSNESFTAWMSPKLSDKATFGAIVQAVLGVPPRDPQFNTDVLIGRRFRHMTSHNERGWPKLVPGTAAPEKSRTGDTEPPF
jgi:hypothetical protein